MEKARTADAGTPARHAIPERLCWRAELAVKAAREMPAPRRLSVERSVTVSAVAPDAPADGVDVGDAGAEGEMALVVDGNTPDADGCTDIGRDDGV